ncbi:MAG: restriction endonuclease [Rubrivivax sp. SCN 71-131]|nr:MAG: restriction endonuclease [Rubrivivax sp. SCN 71-131]
MKLRMAKNSLFAILLRKPWWLSLAIAVALGLVAAALLPAAYKLVGAASGLPFLVIAAVAAWRQARQPSAARIEATRAAVARMAWPAFSALLEQAFAREGWRVTRANAASHDFVLEREGRRMLVGARRWKSAQPGLEALRALQAAREHADGAGARLIALGELSEAARPFAAAHRIDVWQAAEIARALDGLLPGR